MSISGCSMQMPFNPFDLKLTCFEIKLDLRHLSSFELQRIMANYVRQGLERQYLCSCATLNMMTRVTFNNDHPSSFPIWILPKSFIITTPTSIDHTMIYTVSLWLTILLFVSSCIGASSCICTKEYTPYCCDGKVYGNGCEAKCADFAVDTDCTVGACAADAGLPATTPVATAASQDCLRVRGASVSAINGIYKRDERAGGQWINKKKKKYGKNGKVKIKLYRYKKYWMFGTARNDGESITKCGPAGGGNAVKRCNDWSHEQTLKISSSDCTWSSAMEEDTGDSFTDGVTRNPLVIGGILVALVVACGVFIWFGCKK
eukprot:801007_1